jgi:hypothetical protein
MAENKMGPKEAQMRALREARVEQNKRLIDKAAKIKAKGIARVVSIKTSKTGGRGR